MGVVAILALSKERIKPGEKKMQISFLQRACI